MAAGVRGCSKLREDASAGAIDVPTRRTAACSEAMRLWIEFQIEHGYEIPEPIDPATRWDAEDAAAAARREGAPAA